MTSLCGPKWHRLANPGGGDRLWFRFGTRIRDTNGTYVYRFGPEPDDAHCRTIWCFDGKPWTCSACGKSISAERYRPENGMPNATASSRRRP